ncbi:MAG: hypothetical protein HY063_10430 [Bacteroidetes bacterium]|nr:hypothetical protein [Bacteroidota bacterium]
MVSAPHLFRLIQSLSGSEKRYCKIFLLNNLPDSKEGNYVKLFDAVAKQKAYDETHLRKTLRIKGFHVVKHELYKLLLRALCFYHREYSVQSRLHDMLRTIEILFERALYDECESLIRKAKKLASLHENHLAMLELLNWESNVIGAKEYAGVTSHHLDALMEQKKKELENYKLICSARHIQSRLFQFQSERVYVKSKNVVNRVRAIMDFSLLKKELPFDAKLHMYTSASVYFRTIGDLQKTYQHIKQLTEIMQAHPHQIEDRQKTYIALMKNMSIALTELSRYGEALQILESIKTISPKNSRIALFIFSTSSLLSLSILHITGEFEKAVLLVSDEVEKGLENFKSKIGKQSHMEFQFIIAYSYFGAGQYSRAIEWTNKIVNNASKDFRMDLQVSARLLHMIAHLEKGNRAILTYLAKSAQRYFERDKYAYRLEKTISGFFSKKFSRDASAKENREAWKELKTLTEKLLQNPFEAKILNYIDLPNWIESKIQNRPFAEVVKEKSKQAAVIQ